MTRRISVLCAVREDDVFRRLMREMDDGERCTFHIVRSGVQAERLMASLVPDIVVVDAILPGCDGPALVERLREMAGLRMPCVIGGTMLPFARAAFLRSGAGWIVDVPWRYEEVRAALLEAMERIETVVNWDGAQESVLCARLLLEHLGMRSTLRGFSYLSWAAALAACDEARLSAMNERIYRPIAQHERTTAQSVERLIRHAIERTMDTVGAREMYAFFGNTIDPARGKPTNAQMIAMLSQRVRLMDAAREMRIQTNCQPKRVI